MLQIDAMSSMFQQISDHFEYKIKLLCRRSIQLSHFFSKNHRITVSAFHLLLHTRRVIFLNDVALNCSLNFEIVETKLQPRLVQYIQISQTKI